MFKSLLYKDHTIVLNSFTTLDPKLSKTFAKLKVVPSYSKHFNFWHNCLAQYYLRTYISVISYITLKLKSVHTMNNAITVDQYKPFGLHLEKVRHRHL